MASKRAGPEKRGPRQLHPTQCNYPGGCSNDRTTKVNGDLHWLCSSHRDHQNALQRARYKRVVRSKNRKASSISAAPVKSRKKRASRTAPSVVERRQAQTILADVETEETASEASTEPSNQDILLPEDASSAASSTQVASVPDASHLSQDTSTPPEQRCPCSTNNTIQEPSATPMAGAPANASVGGVACYPVQDHPPIYALPGQQVFYVLMQPVQMPQVPRTQVHGDGSAAGCARCDPVLARANNAVYQPWPSRGQQFVVPVSMMESAVASTAQPILVPPTAPPPFGAAHLGGNTAASLQVGTTTTGNRDSDTALPTSIDFDGSSDRQSIQEL